MWIGRMPKCSCPQSVHQPVSLPSQAAPESPLGRLPQITRHLGSFHGLALSESSTALGVTTYLPPCSWGTSGLALHTQLLGQAAPPPCPASLCKNASPPRLNPSQVRDIHLTSNPGNRLLMYSPCFYWVTSSPLSLHNLCCWSETVITQGPHYQEGRVAHLWSWVDSIRGNWTPWVPTLCLFSPGSKAEFLTCCLFT